MEYHRILLIHLKQKTSEKFKGTDENSAVHPSGLTELTNFNPSILKTLYSPSEPPQVKKRAKLYGKIFKL